MTKTGTEREWGISSGQKQLVEPELFHILPGEFRTFSIFFFSVLFDIFCKKVNKKIWVISLFINHCSVKGNKPELRICVVRLGFQ